MSDAVLVLEPKNIIDSVTGSQIRQEVGEKLNEGVEIILIDLTHITFMDSSGLGAMVATLQGVRAKGAELYLCSLNDQIKILMDLTKMNNVFKILPDRSAFDKAIA
ncbi:MULTISPECIES: STAS domain-containing protein [Pseudanabaena]|uniref:Anti-sigma factor antagonist n=2 Tax=Pseudanabaena TaxID=1152 RepID=L8MTX2_9CYAN|nr:MULTISPECIES: STAS domain-containing protein [Pseudanabaena]ELS30224.1 anti-sigma-factor antagonist [Pseudanabaena biceps PCC 7429]MDG3497486.1 STAS domain-containing protein [Pseudanabaena catenata USMAC16]